MEFSIVRVVEAREAEACTHALNLYIGTTHVLS